MITSRKHIDQLFYQIWYSFQANLGSLRLFSEEISKQANHLDQDRIRELAKNLADIFGDDTDRVEIELQEFTPSLDEQDVLTDVRQNPQIQEVFSAFRDSKFKARISSWSRENPKKSYKLADVFWEYFSHPPLSGILLRRGAFVSLVGFLEQLIENLFYCFYYLHDPHDDLADEEREKNARRRAKKANNPDDGWQGRFRKLQEMGVDIGLAKTYFDNLIEITQRRNLLVHKDGVIDRRYLENVSEMFIPNGGDVGKILLVTSRYLDHVFNVVAAFSFALTQSCWRQWQLPEGNEKKANKSLDLFIYSELRKKRYELVVELAKISRQYKLPNTYLQMILINQAIALRELDNMQEMRTVLSEISGKRRKWWVDVAQFIFQEDYSKVQLLLVQAAKNNTLKDITPFWPLFEPVEDEIWFQKLFEHPNRGELPRKKSEHH